MSDNKFILQLKGQQTPKSVVEIKNDKLAAPFVNVPNSSDAVGAIIQDKDSSVVVAKGAENWQLDGGALVPATNLTGNGADYTGEYAVSGSGLWVNAVYTFPSTGDPAHPVAEIFNSQTKWVLQLCGKNLLTKNSTTVDFSFIVKIGSSHIMTKTVTVSEQANFFCKRFVLDFSESEQSVIKASGGTNLTVQLLCADDSAGATIYNGMTILTALQRRIDASAVSASFANVEEVLRDGLLPNDYFSNAEFIDEIEDGEQAYAVFARDGDTVNLSGWTPKEEIARKEEIIVKSDTIPNASDELVGYEYQYMGETNNTYTHGFVYVCKRIPADTLVFSPDTVSCSWADLSVFLQAHTADYNSVVAGTMTYVENAELWRLVFKDANGNTVLTYQQYTGDWERVGFTFNDIFHDGDVVSFVRYTYSTQIWERIDVQPNHNEDIAELYDEVANLKGLGRFLSVWNCATGLAETNPPESPYTYHTGDYFLVGTVGATNYRPDGSSYTIGVASTTVETNEVRVNDVYIYDGTNWKLQANSQREYTFSGIVGSPYDNTNLSNALNGLQGQITTNKDTMDSHIGDTNNPHSVTKAQVGLGNVENTSDLNKPISTATQTALDGKQDTISDLSTIRSNAQAGKTASDTIATYGDIVTHDVAEFATAAQGAKADTALQAGDNVSELVNDAGYLVMGDLTNFVTKNTAQTISGLKTFTGDITLSGTTSIKNTTNGVSYTMLYRDASGIHVGTSTQALLLAGSNARPKFNNNDIAMLSDIPTAVSQLTNDTGFITNAVNDLQNYTLTSNLATVATSGSYNDLSDKPTIGNATLTIQKNSTTIDTFTANATSNKTIDIAVPTKTSDITNDSDYQNGTQVATAISTHNTSTTAHSNQFNAITEKIPAEASSSNKLADKAFVNSSIATNTANFIGTFNSVAELEAYSGTVTNNDYAFVIVTDSAGNTAYDRYKYTTATTPASWVFEYELNNSSFTAAQWAAINSGANTTNIGQIATNTTTISNHIGNTSNPHQVTKAQVGLSNVDNTSDLAKPISTATQTALNAKANTADLATVATSGSYNDLSDKPTIPTVNNATLTIQKNGTTVQTFTANQSTNATANISVPTKTSDITNDSGFITSSALAPYALSADLATVATTGDYDDLSNKPTIPTVGNGTITITQGGISKGTFTTNQSGNTTIALDAGGGGIGNIDNLTITANADDEIQAVAVIDQNTGIAKTWTGTMAEYEAIVTKDPETEYIITDDIGLPATEIGQITEALNNKVDKGHQVVEFQEPTSANNYTWYRKYADGWIEQGGYIDGNYSHTFSGTYMSSYVATTITLPIEMANTNVNIYCNSTVGQVIASGVLNGTTALEIMLASANFTASGIDVSWQVSGMAA